MKTTSSGHPGQGGAARHILDATARLLRHRGYEATTTRAIAREVGLKAGSIYHHFPSKDAIVQAVVNEGVQIVFDAVTQALAALPREAGPRARIETAVRAHLSSSLENSDYTSASIRAFAFLPDHIRQQCRAERRKYEDIWRSLIEAAREAGLIKDGVSEDAVRLLLLGALNWAGEWYRPNKLTIEKIAHDFTASVLRE
jgi:AcrR family transcriptional regulator